jgi:hypothetical protein
MRATPQKGTAMTVDLLKLLEHDLGDDCPICHVQDIVEAALLPAAAAWELHNDLPRLSVALHGGARLLGVLLEEGLPRQEVERAVGVLLDEFEQQLTEHRAFGGPPQGTA